MKPRHTPITQVPSAKSQVSSANSKETIIMGGIITREIVHSKTTVASVASSSPVSVSLPSPFPSPAPSPLTLPAAAPLTLPAAAPLTLPAVAPLPPPLSITSPVPILPDDEEDEHDESDDHDDPEDDTLPNINHLSILWLVLGIMMGVVASIPLMKPLSEFM